MKKKPNERITDGGYFKVGTTSEALKSIGIKDESIYWRKQKIGYIMNEHPEVDRGTLHSVTQLIENPVVVLKSTTREDSIVLLGEVRARSSLWPSLTGEMKK